MIEIKDRWTNRVLFSSDKATSVKEAIKEAIAAGTNLHGADLSNANLSSANLYGADLRDADLSNANLSSANLSGADLSGADLSGAYLYDANLRDANLYGADLRGAYLSGANLRDANLYGADLRDANLYGADLRDADLYGADLRDANLRSANLRDAKGINKYQTTPLLMLLDQPGKLRAYKLVNEKMTGYQYPGIVYSVGSIVSVDNANIDESEHCAAGINVATLDWVMKEWKQGYRIMILEFESKDIAAIPTCTDGKFRLHRAEVVGEKNLSEIGLLTAATE